MNNLQSPVVFFFLLKAHNLLISPLMNSVYLCFNLGLEKILFFSLLSHHSLVPFQQCLSSEQIKVEMFSSKRIKSKKKKKNFFLSSFVTVKLCLSQSITWILHPLKVFRLRTVLCWLTLCYHMIFRTKFPGAVAD